MRRLLARFAGRRGPTDAEIRREIQDHLDLEAEAIGDGGHRDVARHSARRRFGNVAATGEAVRDVWHPAWLDTLRQDLRHGLRALARSPAYSLSATITLALGIGATAAAFCLSDAINRPFPMLPESRLLSIVQPSVHCPDCDEASPAAYVALRDRARSMTTIATSNWRTTLRTSGGSEMVEGFRVSPGTFEVVGAPLALGRGFAADAAEPSVPRTAILSYEFWRDHFRASRGVVDSVVTLGGDAYTVVGVLARDFVFPRAADLYAPLAISAADANDHQSRYLDLFARLAPGATIEAAATEATTIGAQLARESPATDEGWTLVARPIATYHTADVSVVERIAALGALLVFFAACMSAANLAMSRTESRRHELALRTALGVGRGRLLRHLLTEALIVALVAGVLGALLARWGVRAMHDAIPPSMASYVPGWAHAGVGVRVIAFTFVAAAGAMLVFAVLPAFRATRVDPSRVLSDGGRASTGGVRSTRARGVLVVLEVSIALVLLTSATLLMRSVSNMLAGDPGVRLDGVLTMTYSIPARLGDSAVRDVYRRLDENLRATPGVLAAGATSTTPLSNNWWGETFEVPGRAPAPKGQPLVASDQRVTPGYAAAAGVRVLAGRFIGGDDVAGAARTVVVSAMLADAMWPNRSALGRTLVIDSVPWTVVGVARDVRHGGFDEPLRFTLYRSVYQAPQRTGDLAVHTSGDPAAMRDVVRRVVARTDPDLAIGRFMTMREVEARHVSPFRMVAGMLGVMSIVTLVIAVVGLYGLIAYGVAQRVREIGVRIALGASPREILSHVGAGAVRLTAVGVAMGVAGAAMFTRLLGAMLYGVTAADPTTFAGASVVLLLVSLAAAFVPAWRASRVDPTVALRE